MLVAERFALWTEIQMACRAGVGRLRLVASILLGVILCFAFQIAPAQDKLPPLSEVTKRPVDPFKASEDHVVRGSRVDIFAGKRLPQWRNLTEFERARLPSNMNPYHLESWKREASVMQFKAGFGVRRMLHQLQVKLKDGRSIYLADRYRGSDEYREVDTIFEYRGYDKDRRLYSVSYVLYEGFGLFVISADTGFVWSLEGVPLPSPDGSRLASFFKFSDSELAVLHLKVGSANYEIVEYDTVFTGALENMEVNDIHWDGNERIHLRRNLNTQMLLRRTGNGWNIEPLSAPIPDTVNCSRSFTSSMRFPDMPRDRLCNFPDKPIPTEYVYTIEDPVHGQVNPDWLCIFENRNC